MPKNNQTVTSQLRDELFATVSDLRAGKIDAQSAHAISKLSENIIKTVVVELQAAELLGVNKVASLNGESPEQRRIEQGGVVHKIT